PSSVSQSLLTPRRPSDFDRRGVGGGGCDASAQSGLVSSINNGYRCTPRISCKSDALYVCIVSIEKCKDNWAKLRNAYCSALKRRKTKSGQAATQGTPWKYEDQMGFLRPYMEMRNTKTNLIPPSSPSTSVETITSELPAESPEVPESPPDFRSESQQSNLSSYSQRSSSSKKKPDLADIYDMMKTQHSLRQQKQQSKLDLDETDMFFLSMSKAVKALPKLDQTKIKLDLHMAISQAEIRNIEMERVVKTPLRIVSQTVVPPSNQPLPEPSRVYYYHNSPTEINEFSPESQSILDPEAQNTNSTGEENLSTYYSGPYVKVIHGPSSRIWSRVFLVVSGGGRDYHPSRHYWAVDRCPEQPLQWGPSDLQEDIRAKMLKAKSNFKKSPRERLTIAYVETRLDNLEQQWTLFSDTHTKIISQVKRSDLYSSNYHKNAIYDDVEELYVDYKTDLKEMLSKLNSNTQSVVVSNQSSSTRFNRFRGLEHLDKEDSRHKQLKHPQPKGTQSFHVVKEKRLLLCTFCSADHKITSCPKFSKESNEARRKFALENNLCFICLLNNHSAKNCKNTLKCQVCKHRHHSLLHPVGASGSNIGEDRSTVHKELSSVASTSAKDDIKNCIAVVTAQAEGSSKPMRMLRVTAYCRRFLKVNNQGVRSKHLSKQELDEALEICIKKSQEEGFAKELEELRKNEICEKGSLKSLNIFLDSKGIIRVGGRLEMAQLNYDRIHPILIPKESFLTNLLVAEAHAKTMHGGPQTMLTCPLLWPLLMVVNGHHITHHTVQNTAKDSSDSVFKKFT
ncbi:hypothetical protein HW555_012483, partial [Spodoptera exigua]